MNMFFHRVNLVLICVLAAAAGQCPSTLKAPCSCSSTRYEPVSIHCDRADSLESILRALIDAPQYVDSLTISNTPIDQISENIFSGITIRRLIFQNNGLQSIQPGTFAGNLLESLEELEIRTNELQTIPAEGITELRSLRSLVLSDNEITKIDDFAFLHYQSRKQILKLDLSANNISEIPSEGFLGLESIETLILDKNAFTSVPTEALRNIPTLEDLSLSVNRVTQILPGALPMPNLKSLSLEVNQIESLKGEVFQQTPSLLYLYMSNNRFSVIDPKTFLYVPQLKVLAMSHNVALKMIPFNAFQHTSSLIRLELTDCSIGNIEEGAFHKTPKIQVITLARNKLKKIGVSLFSALPHLQSIDLKQNQITQVDDYAFSRLKMLQKLDLSDNRIETLHPNTFVDSFEQTQQYVYKALYLYDNPWNCNHQIVWLIEWLKQSGDIQVTTPGNAPARCAQPNELSGYDLRAADSHIKTFATTIPTTKKYGLGYPIRSIDGSNLMGEKPKPAPIEEEAAATEETPLATILVVLGICLIVLFFLIGLVMLIYCVAKKRSSKLSNPTSSERGDFGFDSSTTSGFASIYDSSGVLTCEAQNGRPFIGLPRNYDFVEPQHLTRSSNWWF